MGVGEGKSIGMWFGPNTVAQVLRKLAAFDNWSNLAVHVALDNTVVQEDISKFHFYLIVCHYTIPPSSPTIVARSDGVHGVLYTRGGKWHPGLPPRMYQTQEPLSQRASIVLLYLYTIDYSSS